MPKRKNEDVDVPEEDDHAERKGREEGEQVPRRVKDYDRLGSKIALDGKLGYHLPPATVCDRQVCIHYGVDEKLVGQVASAYNEPSVSGLVRLANGKFGTKPSRRYNPYEEVWVTKKQVITMPNGEQVEVTYQEPEIPRTDQYVNQSPFNPMMEKDLTMAFVENLPPTYAGTSKGRQALAQFL